jgi:O-antigen/teichoic acid export membrane protein
MGAGPVGVAAAYLTGPVSAALALLFLTRKTHRVRVRFDWSSARQLLYRARSFAAQTLLNSGSAYADALLLPRLIGNAALGFYAAGTLLPSRLSAIPDGLCTATYPRLSGAFHESSASGVRMTFRYLAIVLLACLPIAVCAAALAGPVARVRFPGEPEVCRRVILITVWALPLFGLESVLGYAINAAGADAAQARSAVPAAICSLTVTVALMTGLGVFGACIALPVRHGLRVGFLSVCFARCVWSEPRTSTFSGTVMTA